MSGPRRKDPTFGLGVFIVVVVLIVIGTVLFNAIRGKREYDASRLQPAAAVPSASEAEAPASVAVASAPALAASGVAAGRGDAAQAASGAAH